LKDIKDEAVHIITDRKWFNRTKAFKQVDLKPDDLVEFRATVKMYGEWITRAGRKMYLISLKRPIIGYQDPRTYESSKNNIPFYPFQ
jgi:hypothetical protein